MLIGAIVASITIISYLWVSSLQFAGMMPVSVAILVGTIAVHIVLILPKDRITFSGTAIRFHAISIALMFWCISVLIRQEGFTESGIEEIVLGRMGLPWAFAVVVPLVTTKRRGLKLIIGAWIAGAAVSSLFAIGQALKLGWAIDGWLLMGGSEDLLYSVEGGRVAGLAVYSIPFGYDLVVATPIVLAMSLSTVQGRQHLGVALMLLAMVMTSALVLSGTRSAVVGAVIGCLIVVFYAARRLRYRMRHVLVACGLLLSLMIMVVVATYGDESSRLGRLSDRSALSRVPLMTVATRTALANPLGVGPRQYRDVTSEYYQDVSLLPEADAVGVHTSHNQFLNSAVYYGLPAFIGLLLWYAMLLAGLTRCIRRSHPSTRKDSFRKMAAVGILGGTIGYIVNSLFHNAGPLIGHPHAWLLAGTALVVIRVGSCREGRRPNNPMERASGDRRAHVKWGDARM